ncbi:hypothetical protein [Candidatus Deferrimicrobium sp.]|nr:hypothetical protein [Candidatus Deferrimicrobium sp.]MDO8738324.1 hypothetical protein [Candidatus Deferrimicrobium sp.]
MKATGSKKAQQARGKAIVNAKKKTGDSTDWKKVFAALDRSKKAKR